jgi:murein L,D-transpeptidase YcbB/YkuD
VNGSARVPGGASRVRHHGGSRRCLAAPLLLGVALVLPALAEQTDIGDAIRPLPDASADPGPLRPRSSDDRADARRAREIAGDRPLWLREGRPTAQAGEVIEALLDADARGLSPADYDARALRAERDRLAEGRHASEEELARFDAALTLAVMRFASDSYRGRIDPRRAGFALDIEPKNLDLAEVVLELARAEDPARRLAALEPTLGIYRRLKAALATMRALAARRDLRPPQPSATLHPGDHDPHVPELRAFLAALGDLADRATVRADPQTYDEALAEAVRRFQRRHGLAVDGVIGPATRRALAVPLSARVEQIRLALERIRWLPQRFPPGRFLVVNIPAFRLLGFEHEESGPELVSDVVVGSAARRHFTPVLHAEMRYLVFGPYWNVPSSIARREMLPILRRDLGYLARQDLEIVGPGGLLPLTQTSIDLLAAGEARLRQRPGARNALGRVKFILPNRGNVYLHDTPAKALFERTRRDFSHGCIRVADPLALAEFVLHGQDSWNRQRIAAAMESSKDRRVDLDSPVPVYLLYSTAVVTERGELLFFDDIYGHDAKLARLLKEP